MKKYSTRAKDYLERLQQIRAGREEHYPLPCRKMSFGVIQNGFGEFVVSTVELFHVTVRVPREIFLGLTDGDLLDPGIG